MRSSLEGHAGPVSLLGPIHSSSAVEPWGVELGLRMAPENDPEKEQETPEGSAR